MQRQSIWAHLAETLPALTYGNLEIGGQGKGSTTWAAHSHTPLQLQVWEDFDELVKAEARRPRNQTVVDSNFSERLGNMFFKRIKQEEDVTDCLENVLLQFSGPPGQNLSSGVEFCKSSKYVLGNPDLIAQKDAPEVWGTGSRAEYVSPPKGQRAHQRRKVAAAATALYLFPFETKPSWKFDFLEQRDSHRYIVQQWEVPANFDCDKMRDEESLPDHWPSQKRKIFHLVRQLYGQMVSGRRRYGTMHTYERWFFCRRTEDGTLGISRPFASTDLEPSVFQAIKTLAGFENHELVNAPVHPSSARKADRSVRKRPRSCDDSQRQKPPKLPPSYYKGSNTGTEGSLGQGDGTGSSSVPENLASTLFVWDCKLFDTTSTMQLLTTPKYPSILVKLQRDPRMSHVAKEMANEAKMYRELAARSDLDGVLPRFRGYSTHLGVGMTCIERQLDDFDDIGLENLSDELKQSALRCVKALSKAGVLHGDIALRNMVQSRDDPSQAKIIDLGRAVFCKNKELLADQIERVNILLGLRVDQIATSGSTKGRPVEP